MAHSERDMIRQDIEAVCRELFAELPDYLYAHRLSDDIARQIAQRIDDTEDDLVTAISRNQLDVQAWTLGDIWAHLHNGATQEAVRFFNLCRSQWD